MESMLRRNKSKCCIVSFEVMAIATFQDTSGQRYAGVAGEWARPGSLCKHNASYKTLLAETLYFQVLLCVLSPIPSICRLHLSS